MTQEQIVRHYLQLAHDRGGGWTMAMRMMANEIERLIHLLTVEEAAAALHGWQG